MSKSKFYLRDFGGLCETFSDCCQVLLNVIFTINCVHQKRHLKQAANVTAEPNMTNFMIQTFGIFTREKPIQYLKFTQIHLISSRIQANHISSESLQLLLLALYRKIFTC